MPTNTDDLQGQCIALEYIAILSIYLLPEETKGRLIGDLRKIIGNIDAFAPFENETVRSSALHTYERIIEGVAGLNEAGGRALLDN